MPPTSYLPVAATSAGHVPRQHMARSGYCHLRTLQATLYVLLALMTGGAVMPPTMGLLGRQRMSKVRLQAPDDGGAVMPP